MRGRVPVVLASAVALALVVVGVVVGVRWWLGRDQTLLERAIGYAPSSTVRLSWTDWNAVRAASRGTDLTSGSTIAEVQAMLSRGYDEGLTSGSAMVDSTPFLQENYGFSPATVSWELLAQSRTGSVLVIGLPASLGTDALGATFTRLGYTPPSGSGADRTDTTDGAGVYLGGDELLSRLTVDTGDNLSPQFNNLALDPDRHLLLASDSGPYLREAYGALSHRQDPGGESMAGVAAALGDPASAELYSGDYACSALAMGQADSEDEEAGRQLIARAGGVDPMEAFAMGQQADRQVVVAMAFDDQGTARHNADARATLASGPAPGQGGDFSDRFRLGRVTADGDVVTLRLTPRAGESVLSDLTTGPVLFASC